MKKLLATLLVGLMAVSAVGCAGGNGGGSGSGTIGAEGKIAFSVGSWPSAKRPKALEQYTDMEKRFEEANPEYDVVGDTWSFSLDTFLAKAASDNLPDLYGTYFTEGNRVIKAGYCADLTKFVKKYGYEDMINESIKHLVMADGKYYMLPQSAYNMGLYLHKGLFEQAGLVNEDGSIKVPQTYEEMAETAKIIKDKTGQHGIVICTANNTGGWNFLNIAWAFGTEFMKQDESGRWIATFDSPECAAALQYIKDLRWKYDVIPYEAAATGEHQQKYFGSNQAAMFIGTPPQDELKTIYGMEHDDIVIANLPAGPAGRFSQIGGELNVVRRTVNDDQMEGIFKWIDHSNRGYSMTDDAKKSMEDSYALRKEEGKLVGVYQFSPWSEKAEKTAYERSVIDKYATVDAANVKEFNNAPADLVLKPEEPVACQELYAVLDSCIQEVITNKDADPAALLKEAAANFQVDQLDIAQ